MKLLAVRRLLRIQRVVIRYRLDDLILELPMLPWWLRLLGATLPWRWLPRRKLELTRGARCAWHCRTSDRSSSSSARFSPPAATCCPTTSPTNWPGCRTRCRPSRGGQAHRGTAGREDRTGLRPLRTRTAGLRLGGPGPRRAPEERRGSGGEGDPAEPGTGDPLRHRLAVHPRPPRRAGLQRGARLHPVEVVSDYEKTIVDELDLLREAANASQLRRNFEGSPLLYVPQVYWDWCRPKVLVMERIYGIPVTDLETLRDQRTDFKALAERGVEIFFTQVFRDSFFHADMHPGNIFVSTRAPWSPQYIAVDCGIVGSLTDEDQDYLARNLIAFFKRDYRKVAQLHIDSGWVPAETKVNDFRRRSAPSANRSSRSAEGLSLRPGPAGAAAEDPAEHRRPRPPATRNSTCGPPPSRSWSAGCANGQPEAVAAQFPATGRAGAAPVANGPRYPRTPVTTARPQCAAAGVERFPPRLARAPGGAVGAAEVGLGQQLEAAGVGDAGRRVFLILRR